MTFITGRPMCNVLVVAALLLGAVSDLSAQDSQPLFLNPGISDSSSDSSKPKNKKSTRQPGNREVSRKISHWSFRPIIRLEPPPVTSGRQHNGIDAFILHGLEREGIAPSPPADRATLIRRVYLDLIGLPPTPDQVVAFVNDHRPDAYERLVDRLLASPNFGERWARPWLDLCHYADSDGYLTDQLRPVAWRYRQWLVDALNCNMPFDEFTIQQLAGDLLPPSHRHIPPNESSHAKREADNKRGIATGFLRQTLSNREGGANPDEFRVKQVIDRTRMMGTVWLGLTLGCAQCHDHKYDPLTQQEFFQLYAFFNNADEVNIDAPLPSERKAFLKSLPEYQRRRGEMLAPLQKQIDELQQRWEQKLLYADRHPGRDNIWDRQWELICLVWGGNLGEGQMEGAEIVKLPWKKRTQRQQDDLLDYFLRSGSKIDPARFTQLKLGEMQGKLATLKREMLKVTRAPTMQAALTRRPTYIHERGDFRDRGPRVAAGTPAYLPALHPSDEPDRLRLARWLVSRDNPLTARVTVNRMWQEFFGRGLVLTSEDFGTRGERPSHPRLLDWLAAEFIRTGWDVKALHRLIVTSATYRQSSAPRRELASRDPHNVLVARQASLRMPAETVRDLGLAVSGLLSQKIGGPTVRPPQPDRVVEEAFGHHEWKVSAGDDRYRRGLYTFILRTAPFAQSIIFDAPNPNETCTRRVRSNTPLQALTLLNDPVFFEMAQALAERVLRERSGSINERIDYAFQLCMSRSPTHDETQRLKGYLLQQLERFQRSPDFAAKLLDHNFDGVDPAVAAAWTNLSSVLLNLHEFITRD